MLDELLRKSLPLAELPYVLTSSFRFMFKLSNGLLILPMSLLLTWV